jgi:hypothetical protein
MEKRYPLAYYLETFCGLSSTNGNLNRWKALLRKSSVPIILDSGKWLIKENDFEEFLKGREHCFKLPKQKTVRSTKSKEQSKFPMVVLESGKLQELLIAKKQKTLQSKFTEGL